MPAKESILRILANRNGGDLKLGRQFRRQILQAMYGEIDTAFEQRFFDLLGEHALGTNLGKGDVENLVAGGFNDLQFNFVSALAQQR